MMICFTVTYNEDGKFFYKRCETKREAVAIAKKTSMSNVSRVFLVKGDYISGTFHEKETFFVAEYRDGKRS